MLELPRLGSAGLCRRHMGMPIASRRRRSCILTPMLQCRCCQCRVSTRCRPGRRSCPRRPSYQRALQKTWQG
jgi:hypothetical protein